jgi:hypothetical protein
VTQKLSSLSLIMVTPPAAKVPAANSVTYQIFEIGFHTSGKCFI